MLRGKISYRYTVVLFVVALMATGSITANAAGIPNVQTTITNTASNPVPVVGAVSISYPAPFQAYGALSGEGESFTARFQVPDDKVTIIQYASVECTAAQDNVYPYVHLSTVIPAGAPITNIFLFDLPNLGIIDGVRRYANSKNIFFYTEANNFFADESDVVITVGSSNNIATSCFYLISGYSIELP
jgi:hypothetical protein